MKNYLKQVFHLLCDLGVSSVKALLYFSLILHIVVQYDDMNKLMCFFYLNVKIDLVEVIYYLKQVFHLLYD